MRHLVNMKINVGGLMTDHVNELNSILSRLISIDIAFKDEVQVQLLLSTCPDSWSSTVTVVSNLIEGAKLTFEDIHNLIFGKDVCSRSIDDSSSSLQSTKDSGRKPNSRGRGIGRSKSRRCTSQHILKEMRSFVQLKTQLNDGSGIMVCHFILIFEKTQATFHVVQREGYISRKQEPSYQIR